MKRYYAQYNHGRLLIRKFTSDSEYEKERYYSPYPMTSPFEALNIEIARIKARQLFGWGVKETTR